MDPLSVLREYNINKKQIIEREGRIIFGDISWPKNVKTNYPIWRSDEKGRPKDYYTLECLLYILKHIAQIHPVYARIVSDKKIPVVRRPDRKDVLAYLNGETINCLALDKNAPLVLPTQVKRSADQNTESVDRKPKLEDIHVQNIAATLNVPTKSSDSSLRIKSLSETLTIEKILAIREKRLAKKNITLKDGIPIKQESDIFNVEKICK